MPTTESSAELTAVLPLSECSSSGTDEIEGKAKGLRDLIALGLPVPRAFVITAQAYRDAITSTEIGKRLAAVLAADADDVEKWTLGAPGLDVRES